jgi:hypothetical protein
LQQLLLLLLVVPQQRCWRLPPGLLLLLLLLSCRLAAAETAEWVSCRTGISTLTAAAAPAAVG